MSNLRLAVEFRETLDVVAFWIVYRAIFEIIVTRTHDNTSTDHVYTAFQVPEGHTAFRCRRPATPQHLPPQVHRQSTPISRLVCPRPSRVPRPPIKRNAR